MAYTHDALQEKVQGGVRREKKAFAVLLEWFRRWLNRRLDEIQEDLDRRLEQRLRRAKSLVKIANQGDEEIVRPSRELFVGVDPVVESALVDLLRSDALAHERSGPAGAGWADFLIGFGGVFAISESAQRGQVTPAATIRSMFYEDVSHACVALGLKEPSATDKCGPGGGQV
ncbi:hypothetical protein AB0953_29855 [Streptomyces sp. NPDC046866]|uniref:hypothetical protein n=1 Tax=Streptomyces sp. NPDC046866 TaxID=3154921 RepID=UPI0034527CCA